MLSGIQAGSPFYNSSGATPGMQQIPYGGGRGMMMPPHMLQHQQQGQGQGQQQVRPVNVTPQQGSPEYLRLALQHLQTTLLGRLESEAEAFFDAT